MSDDIFLHDSITNLDPSCPVITTQDITTQRNEWKRLHLRRKINISAVSLHVPDVGNVVVDWEIQTLLEPVLARV